MKVLLFNITIPKPQQIKPRKFTQVEINHLDNFLVTKKHQEIVTAYYINNNYLPQKIDKVMLI